MLRQSLVLMFVLVCVLSATPSVFAEGSWKLYDLRDLISALPPPQGKEGEPAPHTEKSIYGLMAPESLPMSVAANAPRPEKNVDELMNQICGAMNLKCTRLLAGVYGIEAEDAEHGRVQNMLERLRDIYRERYSVELLVFRAPTAQAPALGAETPPADPIYVDRFVVSRRTPTRAAILSQNTFVSGVSPVVAQSAAAYAFEKTHVDDGLDVSVLVGADNEDKDGTSIQVVGELQKVSWPEEATELRVTEGGPIHLKFPVVNVRSVQCHLQIKYGKLVVLGSLTGFNEGESVVVAASVRKL